MLILLRWWNWGPVLRCLGLLWWVLRREEGNEWVQWGCPSRCRGLGLAPQSVSLLLVGAQKGSISMESWPTVPCPMISFLTARAERPRVRGRGSRILRSRHSRWGRIRWIRTKCSLRASTKKKKNKVGYDSFLIALESVFVPHDKISILQPLKWQPKDQ